MQIAVGSAFRNTSATGVARYIQQVAALQASLSGRYFVRVIAAEGDSQTDDVRKNLTKFAQIHHLSLRFVECAHGGPHFPSTEQPERMKALSKVCNAIFDGVEADVDALVYVESDLLWDAAVMGVLVDYAVTRKDDFDVFAPMTFVGGQFYDIYAYRRNGVRFSGVFPFHPDFDHRERKILEVDSVGSCLVMRGEVARQVRVTDDGALIGWCESALHAGYRIGVVPDLRVEHPA